MNDPGKAILKYIYNVSILFGHQARDGIQIEKRFPIINLQLNRILIFIQT